MDKLKVGDIIRSRVRYDDLGPAYVYVSKIEGKIITLSDFFWTENEAIQAHNNKELKCQQN